MGGQGPSWGSPRPQRPQVLRPPQFSGLSLSAPLTLCWAPRGPAGHLEKVTVPTLQALLLHTDPRAPKHARSFRLRMGLCTCCSLGLGQRPSLPKPDSWARPRPCGHVSRTPQAEITVPSGVPSFS